MTEQTIVAPADARAQEHQATVDAASATLIADINELLEEVRGVAAVATRVAKSASVYIVAARAAEGFAVRRHPQAAVLAERVREMNSVVSVLLADHQAFTITQEKK